MRTNAPVPPPGDIYSVYWTITESYGGMTKVMLRRTSSLARAWRRRAQILLLSGNENMDAVRGRLANEPALDRKVKIRNPWEELATASTRTLRKLLGEHMPEPRTVEDALEHTGEPIATRTAPTGEVLQTDRFRRNGSVYISHRRDMKKRGRVGGVRVTLFDRRGRVVAEWGTTTAFYHAWVDSVIGERNAYLFSDSTFVGQMFADYRRENVVSVQTIHSRHTSHESDDLFAPLTRAVSPLARKLDLFDVVVALTQQQADELESAGVALEVDVVSNAQPSSPAKIAVDRDPRRGVLVGRLSPVKRIDHAIHAVDRATTPGLRLDVYGDGDDHTRLTTLIDQLELSANVALRGYTPNPRQHFESASFSILCSQYEGQGLVILESMDAGCIPIAYDIRYGPSSIITHGVDGFLVPAGDIDALAATIDHIAAMSADDLDQMRSAAKSRALDFSDESVARAWADVLTRAREDRRQLAALQFDATLSDVTEAEGSFRLDISVSRPADKAWVAWAGRSNTVYGRLPAVQTGPNSWSADIPASRLSAGGAGLIDFNVDLSSSGARGRARLAGTATTPSGTENVSFYSTKHGNVSARVSVPPSLMPNVAPQSRGE